MELEFQKMVKEKQLKVREIGIQHDLVEAVDFEPIYNQLNVMDPFQNYNPEKLRPSEF